MKKRFCADFDGWICHYAFPACGDPRPEIVGMLRELHTRGWEIMIHTARVWPGWPEPARSERIADMLEWLERHDVPFDSVWGMLLCKSRDGRWRGAPDPAGIGKPWAHAYGDDRGMPQCCPALASIPPGAETLESEIAWLVDAAEHIASRSSRQHEESTPCPS